jgi:hypothetical protein
MKLHIACLLSLASVLLYTNATCPIELKTVAVVLNDKRKKVRENKYNRYQKRMGCQGKATNGLDTPYL